MRTNQVNLNPNTVQYQQVDFTVEKKITNCGEKHYSCITSKNARSHSINHKISSH